MSADPFESVREECETLLKGMTSHMKRWQELTNSGVGASAGGGNSKIELDWTRTELDKGLKQLQWDLEDLAETVKVASVDPGKFGLSAQILQQREDFINRTTETLRRYRDQLAMWDLQQSGRNADKKNALMGGAAAGTTAKTKKEKLAEAIVRENDAAIHEEEQRQETIIRQQDQNLDQLGAVIGRLGQMGEDIHQELVEQEQMITELDQDVEGAQGRMSAALKQVNKVLDQTKDSTQIGIIVCLIVVLIIMAVFVFMG